MAKIEMPSSSINSTGETPKKQLKKVTTGKVTIKQESEIQKLAHNFLAEDLQTIREKLWTDYILPGIKNMVCSAVNIALFGVDRSRTNTGGYSQQRNSYSSYYANANQSRPPQNNYRPNRLDWQNITFDSYADANDVLNEMGHALHEYGQVTIADFTMLWELPAMLVTIRTASMGGMTSDPHPSRAFRAATLSYFRNLFL